MPVNLKTLKILNALFQIYLPYKKLEIDFQFICNSQKYEIHFQLVKL